MLPTLCHLPLLIVPAWTLPKAMGKGVPQNLFGVIILNDLSKARWDAGVTEMTQLVLPSFMLLQHHMLTGFLELYMKVGSPLPF